MISANITSILFLLPCIHLLTLLCSVSVLNKTMCPNQPPCYVSVANESLSDALACVNNFKGGAFNQLHYVAIMDDTCLHFYQWVMYNMLYMFTIMHTTYKTNQISCTEQIQ